MAALTCARLLTVQGWNVRREDPSPPRQHHLMLSRTTADLLAALWNDPMLLAGAHQIRRRAVLWGRSSHFELVPAPAMVIDANDLVGHLAAKLPALRSGDGETWTVDARSGATNEAVTGTAMRRFGRRQARVAPSRLRSGARDDLCIMEMIPDGWAFLMPFAPGKASLQFVADPGAPNLADSWAVVASTRLIHDAVESVDSWSEPMPCMPRLIEAPARPGHLAIGEAALGFDPISGDGVGHALRSVVLAATSLQQVTDGGDIGGCLAAYARTLRKALLQHLEICVALYRDTPQQDCAWHSELVAMRAGIASLKEEISTGELRSVGTPE